MTNPEIYNAKLARYLLNYKDGVVPTEKEAQEYNIASHLYTDSQLVTEVAEILHKLKPYLRSELMIYRNIKQHTVDHATEMEREAKGTLLEHHKVYDKYVAAVLREFCIITIALLIKLERMHKKHILCGNINPYNFMYHRKYRACEPVDLGVLLSDKNVVKAEKYSFGDFIYVVTNLQDIPYNRYLAPELKESIYVYRLQRRLKALAEEAFKRGLVLTQQNEIDQDLRDYHQKQVKYSNRAEIYSVGVTINQILSHLLSKLSHFGLLANNFPTSEISADVIHEAELLLPEEFYNPQKERIAELLNEAVTYVHDLTKEHMEQRDNLPKSIEKFRSLLKRINATTDTFVLEEESEMDDDLDFRRDDQMDEWLKELLEGEIEEPEEHDDTHENEDAHDMKHDHDVSHGGHDLHDEAHDIFGHGDDHGHYSHLEHLHEHVHEKHEAHADHVHANHDTHVHDEHKHDDHKHEGHGDHKHDDHKHEAHGDHEAHEAHEAHGDHEKHEKHEEHSGHEDHDKHEGHDDHAVHGTDHEEDHNDHATQHGPEGDHAVDGDHKRGSRPGEDHGPDSENDPRDTALDDRDRFRPSH